MIFPSRDEIWPISRITNDAAQDADSDPNWRWDLNRLGTELQEVKIMLKGVAKLQGMDSLHLQTIKELQMDTHEEVIVPDLGCWFGKLY